MIVDIVLGCKNTNK